MREGVVPHRVLDAEARPNNKGVVEMRNGGNVPGVTGQSACKETVCVESKICDDYFDDLQGKPGGGRRACRGGHRSNTPKHTLRILSRVLYQTRLTSRLITVGAITVKRSDEGR